MTETYSNKASSTLTASITAIATAIPVASTATFPATGTFRVIIGTELLVVSVTNATTLTASTRGAEGTTTATQVAGAPVTHVLTKGALDAILAQTQAAAVATASADATSKANAAQAAAIAASDPAGAAAAAQTAAIATAAADATAKANAAQAAAIAASDTAGAAAAAQAAAISAASSDATSKAAAALGAAEAYADGKVASVSGAAPIASTGGTTPTISIAAATQADPGSMSAADKTKLDGVEAGAQVTNWTHVAAALGGQAAGADKVFVSDANGSGSMATGWTGGTLTNPTLAGTVTLSATSMQATGNARSRPYANVANVQTTDATVTTLYSWTILDEAATLVVAEALAVKSDASAVAGYVRRSTLHSDGGVVTLDDVESAYTKENAAFSACDLTIDNSAQVGRVRWTGLAGTTIDVGAVVSRLEVSHA